MDELTDPAIAPRIVSSKGAEAGPGRQFVVSRAQRFGLFCRFENPESSMGRPIRDGEITNQ
ncbi:hypothetical protein [Burkholderia plantarii]|uniref:hypothetical protein n=1 Tax=Burkholderia plantarii TaxID=41899 RepID=UPI0011DF2C9E|nr:hypothetical protein [Burkholderia plantarii]